MVGVSHFEQRVAQCVVGVGIVGTRGDRDARAGDWAEARRVQLKLLDLFSLMVNAPNFPEGFRAGYELRGFKVGHARFPLWDPHQWCGQPFLGQFSGAAYPLNWLLPHFPFEQGKIRLAASTGKPIPPGWALDERGLPTQDPAAAMNAARILARPGRPARPWAVRRRPTSAPMCIVLPCRPGCSAAYPLKAPG